MDSIFDLKEKVPFSRGTLTPEFDAEGAGYDGALAEKMECQNKGLILSSAVFDVIVKCILLLN